MAHWNTNPYLRQKPARRPKTVVHKGPSVVHIFNGGFPKDRRTRAYKEIIVPTHILLVIDYSRERYEMINGVRRRKANTIERLAA